MHLAPRSFVRSFALPLAVGLLAFVALQRRAAGNGRAGAAGADQCQRSIPVKGGELLWESVSKGIGSAVAL